MKVLIIKTSSLGDVIHTLPALTDAGKAYPHISFDWVVEENIQEIPQLHPKVSRIIPISFRAWRKKPLKAWREGVWQQFFQKLRMESYDLIIDAQGLTKSAFFTLLARGTRCGLDFASAREPWASWFYQRKFAVDFNQHAILRARQLFSEVLDYSFAGVPDYGLESSPFWVKKDVLEPYLVFLHGTTWPTKHWPENYWHALAKQLQNFDLKIKIPWGNPLECARAERIAALNPHVEVLPKLTLIQMAQVLRAAKAVVAVDTGLSHLSAALEVPTLALYGATDAKRTGTLGVLQFHLTPDFPCAPCLKRHCVYKNEALQPCFSQITASSVIEKLKQMSIL